MFRKLYFGRIGGLETWTFDKLFLGFLRFLLNLWEVLLRREWVGGVWCWKLAWCSLSL